MVPPPPSQPAQTASADGEPTTANHFLRTYGFQLFALLLGIALAFM